MRGIGLLISLLPAIAAMAQDWALLNPAYRYNYSNDGTDTIRHQIRVMDVDTLGPDSFRYELNRIAEQCESCPGVQLMLNRAQFMQGLVTAGSTAWHFTDPGSFVLFPQAGVGESWLADTAMNTTATVLSLDTAVLFGLEVPKRTIGLSSGDSIIIGDQVGVLRWGGLSLIGVHGPDIGVLIPSLTEVFPFQTGDLVEYIHDDFCFDPVIGPYGLGALYKFTFDEGIAFADRIVYDGQRVTHPYWYTTPAMPWSPFPNFHFSGSTSTGTSWTAGREELPMAELIQSYPGQLVRAVLPEGLWFMDTIACLAKHSIDASGRYIFGCERIPGPQEPEQWGSFFLIDAAALTSADTIDWFAYNDHYGELPDVRFAAGIGLERFSLGVFKCGASYELVGAVIDGDTIGTVHSNEYIIGLSMPEADRSPFILQPNPAADRIKLVNAAPGSSVRISDTHGRLVRRIRVGSASETIDVRDLVPGIYFVDVDGGVPQRLMIMR